MNLTLQVYAMTMETETLTGLLLEGQQQIVV